MKITLKQSPTDPVHPIMHGKGAAAKEFNKRQAALWKEGRFKQFDFEQVATVLLEILIDDYDNKYAPLRDAKVKKAIKK